jgi:hypothetical protein
VLAASRLPLAVFTVFGASWGAVAAGFALGMVGGGMPAMRVRAERPLVLAFGAILLSIPQFVLLALHAPVALVVVAAVLGGGQSSFFTALWTTTLQAGVPPAAISRVAALSSVSMLALATVGSSAPDGRSSAPSSS